MVKFNKPVFPPSVTCLLDSDVLINWLTKEEDPMTGISLWKAPHKIIKLIETSRLAGYCTLITIMEIRFVLRRKKGLGESKIRSTLDSIANILKIAIPDEINLLRANTIQTSSHLSPFDAMLIAVGLSLKEAVVISRDKILLNSASKYVPAMTPEEFLTASAKFTI